LPGQKATALEQALCSGFVSGLRQAVEELRETPDQLLVRTDSEIGIEGCSQEIDVGEAIVFEGGPATDLTLEAAFCSGWVRANLTARTDMVENPNQLELYGLPFDACLGSIFGSGKDYSQELHHTILTEGVCYQPGSVVLDGEPLSWQVECTGALLAFGDDPAACLYAEEWLIERLADIDNMTTLEGEALVAHDSGSMSDEQLIDYYESNVIPWWADLVSFAEEASAPVEYANAHIAMIAVLRAELVNAELAVSAVVSQAEDVAREADRSVAELEVAFDTFYEEWESARFGCGVAGVAESDLRDLGVTYFAFTQVVGELDEEGIGSTYTNGDLVRFGLSFCESVPAAGVAGALARDTSLGVH